MSFSRTTRGVLLAFTGLVLLFIHAPLALVVLNSFNTSRTFEWPPPGFTTRWWSAAADSDGARNAIVVSVEVALIATAIALVLGTMAAIALQRFRFFGRDTVSLLIILPIALPGVVTGIALANAFLTMFGIELGMLTLVVSHATFCIVTVFNNAIARLRRLGGNLEEASMDLGAGTFRTFWSVTLKRLALIPVSEAELRPASDGAPQIDLDVSLRDALDLLMVTGAPVVNVVAAALIVLSIVPIWLSQKLAGTDESVAAAR